MSLKTYGAYCVFYQRLSVIEDSRRLPPFYPKPGIHFNIGRFFHHFVY
jgi:hypothetical protein